MYIFKCFQSSNAAILRIRIKPSEYSAILKKRAKNGALCEKSADNYFLKMSERIWADLEPPRYKGGHEKDDAQDGGDHVHEAAEVHLSEEEGVGAIVASFECWLLSHFISLLVIVFAPWKFSTQNIDSTAFLVSKLQICLVEKKIRLLDSGLSGLAFSR